MKTVKDLKVGMTIESKNEGLSYGVYSNQVITEIKETKSGRLKISYSYVYTSNNGDVKTGINNLRNGAISPNTLLSDFTCIFS
jgi:hypothetical protein